jgi:1,4-dihydroxy-2-naphthoate octaprenyltransferase
MCRIGVMAFVLMISHMANHEENRSGSILGLKKITFTLNTFIFLSEIKNTVKLLRFSFSVFLLPVSLFSFFYIHPQPGYQLLLVLIIWHLLVFPSSNGYNSYHDKDEGPIGGLRMPPKVTKQLLRVCNGMDALALLLSFAVNLYFVFFVGIYILASRLYSNRGVRLKKLPVTGFLIVFFFQGAWIFCANILALSSPELLLLEPVILSALAVSCMIGTVYPITQIYQHEADGRDGVTTLSMLLGTKGTFIFSALLYALVNILVYFAFSALHRPGDFFLFSLVMLPSALFFFTWALRSFKDAAHVNFKNTMIMLVLSSMLNNLYFFILLFK